MRFLACLLATTVLPPLATNASPTTMLPSLFASWPDSLNPLRWRQSLRTDDVGRLEKRQSANAFDHNPDGSQFLWVLQDTYQGKTFFEYVETRDPNGTYYLYLGQSVDFFYGTRPNQVSQVFRSTEMTAGDACTINPPAEK